MIEGKHVVITGCLSGIGKQTMETFVEYGAVVIPCAYKEDEEFSAFCDKYSLTPVYFDMSDNDSVKSAAREILSRKIALDGIVNIAGINKDAIFGMVSYKDMFETFQINFFSQILFTQYLCKNMINAGKGGSIVFTSSITALDGNIGQVAYGASKAALIGAMKSMALELGDHSIRVNCVAPGVIDTPMTAKLSEQLKESKLLTMDIPRLGLPVEAANVYMYLMSDFSSHITGQTIRIDGGIRS